MSQSEITRILVIEDDRVTAKLISKKLRERQWIADIAHTARDGLEACRKGSYDVLCIDHVPPDADGLLIIREILDWDSHPPILIITASGTEEVAVEAFRLGVDDYIIKDIDGKYLELLVPLIEKITLYRRHEIEGKKAQKELEESEDRFKTMVDSLSDGIWHIDADARTTYVNPQMTEMLGYTIDEMMGMHLFEFTDERGKKLARANLKRREAGIRERSDFEFIGKNGERMYAFLETAPMFDDAGNYIGSIAGIQDTTERKAPENAFREGKSQVWTKLENILAPEGDNTKLNLADVIDVPAIQSMLDHFYELMNLSMAIIDVNGTVIASTDWQNICTKFHRVNPESAKHCKESDTELTSGVTPGEFKLYQCKNHMWDMVTPIMVGEQHAGNLFVGQFFFDDEEVDYELFRSQAKTYGFDEEQYLAALEEVPRRNRETLYAVMSLFSEFAMTISKLSYSNIQLARTLIERDTLLERLGESEKRYRRMIDASPAMIFLVRDGKYMYANPAAGRELGYENPEDLVNLSVEQIIDPEIRSELFKRMKRVTEDGIANPPLEMRIVRADGSILICESTSIPIHLDDGDAILVMGRNITDRKIAENALRESEAKYRDLFDTSMDVVFLSTVEGRFIDINRAGEDLFGYTREELLELDIHDIYMNPSDRDSYRKAITKKGFVKNYEVVFKKKDETPIEAFISATVRRNAEGEIIGYQGIIKDITDLNRTQNQLIRAQKMEAIGTLAGGIAHDFNNVLATIMGYSSFLKKKVPQNDELYDGLEIIENASTRASDLTSQLLAYTRKSAREIKAINLNRILREVYALISKTFDKSIRIRLNTEANLPIIEGDESQMYQVIMNIAVNAQHAMPDGGDLTMETYAETIPEVLEKTYFSINPGSYTCLKITDTGVGMDGETLSKIFEPYFTTRSDKGGSGLGMSVVFGIVKSHNGYIDVVSEPGRGSEVVISFPVSEKEETKTENGHIDIDGGTEEILVIDDEIMILYVTRDILEESGYAVRITLSGKKGIEMAQRRMSDLVILDLKMPEIDGGHVLRQLIDIDPNVKILMSSGYVEEEQRNEVLDMGASGFIHKPFKADDLRKHVRYILNMPQT